MANTVRNQPGTEQVEHVVVEESQVLDNLQATYEQNKKRINIAVTLVLLAVVGFFAYQKLYKEPAETKAASEIAFAQQSMQLDSLTLALNGDAAHQGFVKIAKKYSGTKAGNLANYYAGLCYLQLGDAQNAIKYLKEFDNEGTSLKYVAAGALGDAYMEAGKTKEGIEHYQTAVGDKENIIVTPMYLYRLAIAYETDKQNEKAIAAFKRIRDEFPQSAQARETDKNLARLGELN